MGGHCHPYPLGLTTRGVIVRLGDRDLVTFQLVLVLDRPTHEAATTGREDVEEEEDQVWHEEDIRVHESRKGSSEKPQSQKPSTAKEPTREYEADRKREFKDEEHVVNTAVPSQRATLPETEEPRPKKPRKERCSA